MADLIEEFIRSRGVLSGDRSTTSRRYRRICECWEAFLEQRDRPLTEALPEDLLTFIAHREGAGVKGNTIRGELCIIRTFYEYLLAQRTVLWNPAASLPMMICSPPQEGSYLTVDECLAMLSTLDTSEPLGLRDYVIVALLWSTGLRSSELCALTWDDVDLDEGSILVRDGKGGRQRLIYLNDRVQDDLKAYRTRLGGAAAKPLFPSSQSHRALSGRRLNELLEGCAARAELTKSVSALTFRHTFATHMFEAGASMDDIKELMGHTDPTETTIYVHVSLDAAKQLLNAHIANPQQVV